MFCQWTNQAMLQSRIGLQRKPLLYLVILRNQDQDQDQQRYVHDMSEPVRM